ncbi:MAG: GTP-binding protein [Pseudomonadota bacterium]
MIPVHILSGFLGSGKTTLLNQLLKRPDCANSLVIINEFGTIPIDHHMVEKSAATETVVELSNGCLCCNIRGELIDHLSSLDLTGYDRVLIETTGIADPLPIYQAIALHPALSQRVRPGIILVVFDTMRGTFLLKQHEEAVQQITLADTIYLSRLDMKGDRTASEHSIRQVNPTANIVTIPEEILLDDGLRKPAGDLAKPTTHSRKFQSVSLTCENTMPARNVTDFINFLQAQIGGRLLRIKGLFACQENEGAPLLVQVSGSIFHEPVFLNAWPDDNRTSQCVVIFSGTEPQKISEIFESFFGAPAIDRPDGQALHSNPLSITGF